MIVSVRINLNVAFINLAEVLGKVYKRNVQIYTYANNHYAGFSSATVEMFRDLWRKQVGPIVPIARERHMTYREPEQGNLFER